MMKLHAVWHCRSLDSTEHFALSEQPQGWVLRGVSLLPLEGVPVEIRYEVAADTAWLTRRAAVDVSSAGGSHQIEIDVSDDSWVIDGSPVGELSGCEDIDFGWTPATNVIPMKRLDIEVGATAVTRAALLRFPELTWEPREQTYERLTESKWLYRSGTAEHVIDVTPEGVVCRYGDLWWGSVDRVD